MYDNLLDYIGKTFWFEYHSDILPRIYSWEDVSYAVCEDELYDSPKEYCRPDPPIPIKSDGV